MAIYWVLAYQLQRPEGLDCLVQEIDEVRASWTANNPGAKFEENLYEFVSRSTLPLLVSTIQETLRLTTYVTAIRDVDESCEFGGYLLEKGEQVRMEVNFL
jgi:cytochrome P450